MNNKRCGTCRHWRKADNGANDVTLGDCKFPLPTNLPVWMKSMGSTSLQSDGVTCNAWEKALDARDLCGEILQTLRTIFMRGTLTTRDNAQFGSMLDEWSTRLLEIKR